MRVAVKTQPKLDYSFNLESTIVLATEVVDVTTPIVCGSLLPIFSIVVKKNGTVTGSHPFEIVGQNLHVKPIPISQLGDYVVFFDY